MKCFHVIDDLLSRIENVLIIFIVISMIFLAFLQVILRNLFETSVSWADIFLRHLVLWIGFIGASLATREERHINIDILSRLLSKKVKTFSQIIVMFFSAAVCFFLMRAAIGFIQMEREGGAILFLGVPDWVVQIIIPIGFGTMMLRFFMRGLEHIILLCGIKREGAL